MIWEAEAFECEHGILIPLNLTAEVQRSQRQSLIDWLTPIIINLNACTRGARPYPFKSFKTKFTKLMSMSLRFSGKVTRKCEIKDEKFGLNFPNCDHKKVMVLMRWQVGPQLLRWYVKHENMPGVPGRIEEKIHWCRNGSMGLVQGLNLSNPIFFYKQLFSGKTSKGGNAIDGNASMMDAGSNKVRHQFSYLGLN